MTIFDVNIGALIKSRREATPDPMTGRPYTQQGLADAVPTSRSTIKKIENDGIDIDAAKANRLAELLDVTVEELVRAMGYEIGTGPLSADEAELVRLYRRTPEAARPGLVTIAKAAAQQLLQLQAQK